MDFKKGYKTTEFWIAAGTTVGGFIMAVVAQLQAQGNTQKNVGAGIGLAIAAVVVHKYVDARTQLKIARNQAVASGTSPLSFASVADVPITARGGAGNVRDEQQVSVHLEPLPKSARPQMTEAARPSPQRARARKR